tara:strand:+ start:2411 stop:4096 length:1686 start_codon:yes stop_codon:yes gene_type:complete
MINYLSKIYDLFPELKIKFISQIFIHFINAINDLLLIYFLFIFFNNQENSNSEILNWISLYLGVQVYEVILYGMIITLGLSFILKTLSLYFTQSLIQSFRYLSASHLLKSYLSRDYKNLRDYKPSELTKNLITECDQSIDFVISPSINMINSAILITVLSSVLFYINYMAAILAMASLGIIYLSIFFLSRKDLEKNKLIREEENKRRYNIPLSSFSLIKELKFYDLNAYFAKQFEESNKALSNAMTTIQTRTQSPKFLVESALLIIVSIATLSIYASNNSSDRLELLSILSSFGFAAYRIIPSIQAFFYGRSLFKFGSESFLILYDEISESETEKVLVKRANINLASIKINPYYYELGERKFKLLKKLEFFSGHSYLILGKSGLGKTTLIDNISGLYKNDQISYFNKKGKEIEIEKINVGIVSQNTTVLDKPLFFNISLREHNSLSKKEINFCNELLDLVGLTEEVEERFIAKDGVGEMGAFLSGGQKQRLAICRALFKRPNLLIFDETFSGIKEEMEGKILNSVKLLLPESILLIVSHRNSTSEFVSDQIDLDNNIEVLE